MKKETKEVYILVPVAVSGKHYAGDPEKKGKPVTLSAEDANFLLVRGKAELVEAAPEKEAK